MKHFTKTFVITLALAMFCACSQDTQEDETLVLDIAPPSQDVEDLFEESETQNNSTLPSEETNAIAGHEAMAHEDAVTKQQALTTGIEFDIDLTTMSSTMVFSQIYDIMVNYNDYIGQSINLVGNFNTMYYEEISQTLNFVVINDATGCCPQGLELKFADESIELPESGTIIGIQGQFTTYKEGEFEYFCILVDELSLYES